MYFIPQLKPANPDLNIQVIKKCPVMGALYQISTHWVRIKSHHERHNKDLEKAWIENEKNPLGQLGYLCVVVRTLILDLSKKQYGQVSELNSHQAIKNAEDGKARTITYSKLVNEWPKIFSRDDSEIFGLIQAFRLEASNLLTQVTPFKSFTNRFIARLIYFYGEETINQVAGITIDTIRHRDREGYAGKLIDNINLVKKIIEFDIKNEFGLYHQARDSLMEHPFVEELFEAWISDEKVAWEAKGKKLTNAEQLALIFKSLASIEGEAARDKMAERYQIGHTAIRSLMRLELNAEATQKITRGLVEAKVTSEVTATYLNNRSLLIESLPAVNESIKVVEKIREALTNNSITTNTLAVIFNTSIKPSEIFPIINNLRLGNAQFSFHALLCLACKEIGQVEDLMEQVLSARERTSEQQGKELGYAYQLMLQYGLQLSDLPKSISKKFPVIKFPKMSEVIESRDLLDTITRVGDKKSIDVVNSWIKLFDIRSCDVLANTFKATSQKALGDGIAAATSRAGLSIQNVNDYVAGKVTIPLPWVKKLLYENKLILTEDMFVNWHLDYAEKVAQQNNLIFRAVDTYISSKSEKLSGFWRNNYQGRADVIKAHTLIRYHAAWKSEERTSLPAAQEGLDKIFKLGSISPEEPVAIFITLSGQHSLMSAVIESWCCEMEKRGNSDIRKSLINLASKYYTYNKPQKPNSIERVMETRNKVLRQYHLHFPNESNPAVQKTNGQSFDSNQGFARLISQIPGVTRHDLIEWVRCNSTI